MDSRLSALEHFAPFFPTATPANHLGGLPSASKVSISKGMWWLTASALYFLTNNGRNAMVRPPLADLRVAFVVQLSWSFQSSHQRQVRAPLGCKRQQALHNQGVFGAQSEVAEVLPIACNRCVTQAAAHLTVALLEGGEALLDAHVREEARLFDIQGEGEEVQALGRRDVDVRLLQLLVPEVGGDLGDEVLGQFQADMPHVDARGGPLVRLFGLSATPCLLQKVPSRNWLANQPTK